MSSIAAQASPRTSGERYRRQLKSDDLNFRIPAPKYRHAAPSAPWPWMDFDIDACDVPSQQELPGNSEWGQYPQSLFGNWTNEQVKRCQMLTKCSNCDASIVRKIGVFDNGNFDRHVETRTVRTDDADGLRKYWDDLRKSPPSNMRVQALFVEDMTLPLLQMLGTRYNVEPFFFASSVNWIPSRYREDPKALKDHITVVLPFIRVLKKDQRPIERSKPWTFTSIESSEMEVVTLPYAGEEQSIDTQAPLSLPENKILIQDLLSLHMVRKTTTSTIISYHSSLQGTSAKHLQSLVQRTGDSVYWSKIFKRSRDPTFFFLASLWYALYAWDEAFEDLFRYMSALEHDVIESHNIELIRELHKLQAHLLHYKQLLRDFLQSVKFVGDTPNPAMNDPSVSEAARKDSAKLLRIEVVNLVREIERLDQQRETMSARLDNAIHLTFATMSIQDNKAIQELAEVTTKDCTVMKQIAYLSMVFLPATCLANIFSMNVREMINPDQHPTETLAHYVGAVIGLTSLTLWLAVVVRKDSTLHSNGSGVLRRVLWPLFYAYKAISSIKERNKSADLSPPPDTLLDKEQLLDAMQPDLLSA